MANGQELKNLLLKKPVRGTQHKAGKSPQINVCPPAHIVPILNQIAEAKGMTVSAIIRMATIKYVRENHYGASI